MAIDLITGHQGVSHISADQIATINNAMMDNFGANKVMRLVGGELTADGLTITISEGYWRVNGFDMEIQEGETLYIDPTTIGLSRIDDIYVEILQDIPTGAQRAEIYIALGEPSATPTAPDEPTAPYLNTDILLQVVPLASVTVTEGAMVMTDLSVAYEMVTPSEISDIVNVYGAKNLNSYPYHDTSNSPKVVNGITFTDMGDGTIKVNGTSTGVAQFFCHLRIQADSKGTNLILPNGAYILSGSSNLAPTVSVLVNITQNNTPFQLAGSKNGEDVPFIANGDDYYSDKIEVGVVIYIPSGVTCNNVIFKPMIRLASIQDDTYEPYAKTNRELTDAFTNQVANSDDTYSPSKAYKVGEHCIYNNVIYKCITACSAAAWSVNQNCFEPTTLTTAVTELNSELNYSTSETVCGKWIDGSPIYRIVKSTIGVADVDMSSYNIKLLTHVRCIAKQTDGAITGFPYAANNTASYNNYVLTGYMSPSHVWKPQVGPTMTNNLSNSTVYMVFEYTKN